MNLAASQSRLQSSVATVLSRFQLALANGPRQAKRQNSTPRRRPGRKVQPIPVSCICRAFEGFIVSGHLHIPMFLTSASVSRVVVAIISPAAFWNSRRPETWLARGDIPNTTMGFSSGVVLHAHIVRHISSYSNFTDHGSIHKTPLAYPHPNILVLPSQAKDFFEFSIGTEQPTTPRCRQNISFTNTRVWLSSPFEDYVIQIRPFL